VSLPTRVIDRLFERLAGTYMAQWSRQFDHVPVADAKTAWAHELAGFGRNLEAVAWALENLPPKPPNAIEFKLLCRSAPTPKPQALPEPPSDPARIAAELAKLGEMKRAPPMTQDARAWAKVLRARDESGEKLSPTVRLFYRQALRLHLLGIE
jgi:hypothetical protein